MINHDVFGYSTCLKWRDIELSADGSVGNNQLTFYASSLEEIREALKHITITSYNSGDI